MSDTNLTNARVQLKYDTKANWSTVHSTFIPRSGEMVIYAPDETYTTPRFKVGDGTSNLKTLPFSNDQLIMKNGSALSLASYLPAAGELVVITSTSANPIIKIGNGTDKVSKLPAYGTEGAVSINTEFLTDENGDPINRGKNYRFVYFQNGVPVESEYTIWRDVPADADFTLHEEATTTKAGIMSAEDKTSLEELKQQKDNLVLKNTFASKTAYGIVKVGEGLDETNGVIKVNTSSFPTATPSFAGLMSAADKEKLDELNNIVIDDTLSTTSTNPIQNKVINSEITKLGTLITQENSTTLTSAKNYTDGKIGELLGQAPENLNSLEELAAAMENNPDVVSALRSAIGNKANSSDLTATSSKIDIHTANENNPHKVTAAQVGLGNVENKNVNAIKNEILTKTNLEAVGVSFEAYNEFAGADAGLVPASAGEEDKYLAADGEWKTISVPEISYPVTSVNNKVGAVKLTATDVGALPESTSLFSGNYSDLSGAPTLAKVATSGNYNDLTDIPAAITIDANLTSTGTNPVQGKAIYTALAGKQPTGDYVTKDYLTNQKYLTGISKTDVTTALGYTPPQSDTNTTYSAGTGLSLSGTTFNIKTGYTNNNKNYKVQTDSSGNLYVNVPWTDNDTTYSTATTSSAGLMSATDKTKLNNIEENANYFTYTLPNATASIKGGVKIGSNLTISSGVLSLSSQNVTNALGYTPAKSSDIPNVSNFVTSTALTQTLGDYAKKTDIPDTSNFVTTNSLNGYIKTISFAGTNLSVTGTTASIAKTTAQTALGLGSAAYKDDTDFASTDTFSTSKNGLVPKPSSSSSSNYLCADGSWSTPSFSISYGSSASALESSASGGTSSSVSRSDHVHPYPALTSCSGILTLAKGGTGGTTKSTARTGIGIYSGTSTPTSSSSYSNGDIYFKYSL